MWYRYPIHVRLKGWRKNGHWYRLVQQSRPGREDRQVKRIHRGPYVSRALLDIDDLLMSRNRIAKRQARRCRAPSQAGRHHHLRGKLRVPQELKADECSGWDTSSFTNPCSTPSFSPGISTSLLMDYCSPTRLLSTSLLLRTRTTRRRRSTVGLRVHPTSSFSPNLGPLVPAPLSRVLNGNMGWLELLCPTTLSSLLIIGLSAYDVRANNQSGTTSTDSTTPASKTLPSKNP